MDLKKVFFPLLSILIGLGVFALVIGYAGVRNILSVFKSISIFYLFMFFLVTTLIMLLSVFRWQIILRSYGYNVAFIPLFCYNICGYAVGYLVPTPATGAGVPLRAYLLKKQKIPMAEGLSSIAVDKAMEIAVNFLFAVFAVLIFILPLNISPGFKNFSVIFSFIVFGLVLLFFINLYFKKGFFSTAFRLFNFIPQFALVKSIRKEIRKLELYIHFFLRYRWKSFMLCSMLSVLVFKLMVFESKFGLLAFGYDAKLAYVFLAMAAIGIAVMLPIPAALGVLEVSQASMFLMLGINPYIGIAFALVIRLKDFIWTAIGLVLLSNTGINILNLMVKDKRRKKHGTRIHS